MFSDYGKKIKGIIRVVTGSVLPLLVSVTIWMVSTVPAYCAIIINAPMTDTNSSGWVLGGNPASAYLTGTGGASPAYDPAGQGWLRLTNIQGNQTGFAYNTTPFDLSAGVLIQFDYASWGGSGADGTSVFLFDSNVSTFNIGAFGGSLGYAQKMADNPICNGGTSVSPAVPGISGGYVGIGLDEFGNYAACTEGRYEGWNGNSSNLDVNTVTVRGPVVGFGGGAVGSTLGASSYPWLYTSGSTAGNGGLSTNNVSSRPSQTGTGYRKVIIQITPAPNPQISVWIQFGYNTNMVQVVTSQPLPAISTSQTLMIGFGASTGGSTNYHDIRNLLVTSLNTTTAIDLGITKTASVTTATLGSPITYTVTARNYGPNNIQATGVGIVDNVPASITGVTWTCTPSGGATCGAPSGTGNAINTTATLPMNGAVIYTISGTVSAPAPAQLSNTASLVIPGAVTDYDPNDDSATVSIPVTSNLSTSTKTVVDLNGGSYSAGDVLQYTITLNDNGAAASGVSVTDTIDANLTNFTVVSFPAGATNSSTASALNITGITVPTNGSVSIVFTAAISGTATPGTTINNTATVTNPSGTGASPVAPVVTVAGSTSGTGTKQLYLYYNPYILSRTPNTTSTGYATIIYNGAAQIWTMNPAAAAPITINPAVSATVPVTLYLRRNTNSGNRNVQVNLQCSSGGTILTQTQTLNLSGTITAYTFNLPIAAPITCGQGSTWNLTVSEPTGSGSDSTRVYPASGGNPSHVDLPATTVINVNPISLYNAAYPGGSVITSETTGSTVYIRAVVSDPFGSFDIVNTPTITIKDPSNNTQVSAAPTTLVATDTGNPSLTKTFQYTYNVPASPTGNWSISVTATEGTEATVSNTAYATMPVTIPLPSLTVVKSASPSPSVNPGQVVTYTVLVTNTGAGAATNVVLTDNLSPYLSWGIAGFTFTPSTSGLTLGTPDFSQNNGASWGYAPVSGAGGAPAGYDATVTNWRIPMTGSMNANGANFTITYTERVK
ncbi:MAG: hypothetical protein ABSA06_09425 [Geobacteraceae bacterium]|jgi:uncharacterized repeat protein (TIGR01451 family)/fimbrial isopeptide formation D2 family protein